MTKKAHITLDGLDARVSSIEELLPQLATKADLNAAINAAIAPLATKAELSAAIAPLATRSEMLALHESLRGDIQLLADSVLSLHQKIDARRDVVSSGAWSVVSITVSPSSSNL